MDKTLWIPLVLSFLGFVGTAMFAVIAHKSQKEATDNQNKIIELNESIGNAVERVECLNLDIGQSTQNIEGLTVKSNELAASIKTSQEELQKLNSDTKRQIEETSSNLINLQVNRDILVRAEFVFQNDKENIGGEHEVFYYQMRDELTRGNYYELKMSSNGKVSAFGSDNNSFQIFQAEIYDNVFGSIDSTYTNAQYYGESLWAFNPQKIRINYLLNYQSLGFPLNDLKVGDKIQFVLRKVRPYMLMDENSLYSKRKRSSEYFKDSFSSFSQYREEWPKAKIRISIMTRDGRVYECKGVLTDLIVNEAPDYGIYTKQIVEKVIKSAVGNDL